MRRSSKSWCVAATAIADSEQGFAPTDLSYFIFQKHCFTLVSACAKETGWWNLESLLSSSCATCHMRLRAVSISMVFEASKQASKQAGRQATSKFIAVVRNSCFACGSSTFGSTMVDANGGVWTNDDFPDLGDLTKRHMWTGGHCHADSQKQTTTYQR